MYNFLVLGVVGYYGAPAPRVLSGLPGLIVFWLLSLFGVDEDFDSVSPAYPDRGSYGVGLTV